MGHYFNKKNNTRGLTLGEGMELAGTVDMAAEQGILYEQRSKEVTRIQKDVFKRSALHCN